MNRFIDIQVHCRVLLKGWLAARARGWDGEDFYGVRKQFRRKGGTETWRRASRSCTVARAFR